MNASVRTIRDRFLPVVIAFLAFSNTGLAQAQKEQIVDLSQVPQIHETADQRDVRMQWFRDAKFGMFIHWGPCTVGDREIGWAGRRIAPGTLTSMGHAPRIRTTTIITESSTR